MLLNLEIFAYEPEPNKGTLMNEKIHIHYELPMHINIYMVVVVVVAVVVVVVVVMVVAMVVVAVVVVGFSSLAMILRECTTIHSPCTLFFF